METSNACEHRDTHTHPAPTQTQMCSASLPTRDGAGRERINVLLLRLGGTKPSARKNARLSRGVCAKKKTTTTQQAVARSHCMRFTIYERRTIGQTGVPGMMTQC